MTMEETARFSQLRLAPRLAIVREMFRIRALVLLAAMAGLAGCRTSDKAPAVKRLAYPTTQKVNHVDDYNGVKVVDPYRWLEDDNAPATKQWVEAQNKVTFSFLDQRWQRVFL